MPAPKPKYRLENTACRQVDVWRGWPALLRGSRAVQKDTLHALPPQGSASIVSSMLCCSDHDNNYSQHRPLLPRPQAFCWYAVLPSANMPGAQHIWCVLAAACEPHLCRGLEARRGDPGAVDGARCPGAAKGHAVQQLHRQDHPGVASQWQQGIAGQPAAHVNSLSMMHDICMQSYAQRHMHGLASQGPQDMQTTSNAWCSLSKTGLFPFGSQCLFGAA